MRNLQLPGRSPVHSPHGMACTSHPLSSQTAIDVLKSGGNAMDAAIAAAAVQCVVEPASTGIGGDCFCLYSPQASGEIVAFNGSGKAPAAADVQWFHDNGITTIERQSAHAVTVPSAVDGWQQLIADHGRKDLGELLQYAIGYAREGYPVSSRVHFDLQAARDVMAADPNLAGIFLRSGQVPGVGQRQTMPGLANALDAIARHGRDAFYHGEIAREMVDCLQSHGGLHTLEDFAAVSGDYVTPISTDYRGYRVFECPPNGQGIIALLLLNIMHGFPPSGDASPINADRLHLELEAGRLAYRARNLYVADPQHVPVPVEALLSEDHAAELRAAIDPARAIEPPPEIDLPNHQDTVYITVVDKDRNACSFINTVFDAFGSGLTTPTSGIVFNNRATGFSLDPGSPNCIAGGKRPLHTIIPGMVTHAGKVVMSFGVMGGQYQAFGHMQFLTRLFDYGLDIQQAMDLPRMMVDPFSGEVEIEDGVPASVVAELEARGHRLRRATRPIGGSQAIWIDHRQQVLTGGSDPRKDGCAIGY